MIKNLRLYLLQLKMLTALIPRMLIILTITATLCAIALYFGIKTSNVQATIPTVKVAVVSEDPDNSILGMAKDIFDEMLGSFSSLFLKSDKDYEGGSALLNNMAGTSSHVVFIIMDEKDAIEQIKNDEISLVIYVDANDATNIMNCNNTPIRIVYKDRLDIIPVIAKELVEVGGRLMTSAQAGTLTTATLYYQYDKGNELENAYNHIDSDNFTYTLERNGIFKDTSALYGDINSPIIFYISSAISLVLLIGVSSFSPALTVYDNSFCKMAYAKGINIVRLYFIQFISLFSFYLILLSIGFSIISYLLHNITMPFEIKIPENTSISLFTSIFVVALFLCAFSLFIISFIKNAEEGIMYFFFISTGMMFLSGGLIPSAFFPYSVQLLASYIPFYSLQRTIITGLTSDLIISDCYLNLLIWSIILIVLSIFVSFIKWRKVH